MRLDAAPKGRAPIIVQFKQPLTRAERARIQGEHGLRLSDYLPEGAYVEVLTAEAIAKLARDPLFRASMPFQPAFKLAPTLGKVRFRTTTRKRVKGLWLTIVLFAEADPARVADQLKKLKATRIIAHDDRPLGERPVSMRRRRHREGAGDRAVAGGALD